MSERHKFICNKCNKDFATITLLNRHLQKKKIPCNSKEKETYSLNKRKCQHCDKILCTPNNLRYHENICKKKSAYVFEEPLSMFEDSEDEQENDIIENSEQDKDKEKEVYEIMQNNFEEITNHMELQNKQWHELLKRQLEDTKNLVDEMRNEMRYEIHKINKKLKNNRADNYKMDNIDIDTSNEKIHLDNKDITIKEYIDDTFIKFSEENKKLRIKLNESNIYIASKKRIGQTQFRRDLFKKFNNKCLITDTKCDTELEACHIISLNKGGTYDLDNGILLNRNLHATFDKYYWSINPDTLKICVNLKEETGEINKYKDEKVDVLLNDNMLKNLEEHYKIFVSKQLNP
jgi:hypothetical protein